MNTIFLNSENTRTSEYYVLVYKLPDKFDLRRDQNSIALSSLSIYYTWKNIKSSCNSNKFKISAPTWEDEFQLPDGSYLISDVQDYFEYILKRHNKNVDNPSIRIYVNIIENKLHLKLKMIISKIQEYYIHLFQANHLVVYSKFHQQIVSF